MQADCPKHLGASSTPEGRSPSGEGTSTISGRTAASTGGWLRSMLAQLHPAAVERLGGGEFAWPPPSVPLSGNPSDESGVIVVTKPEPMRWPVSVSSSATGPSRPGSPATAGTAGPSGTALVRSRFEWALAGIPAAAHRDADPRSAGQPGHRRHRPADRRLHPALLRLPRGGPALRDELRRGVWTLIRESPDFSSLDFRQRFTGTFSEDENPSPARGRKPQRRRVGARLRPYVPQGRLSEHPRSPPRSSIPLTAAEHDDGHYDAGNAQPHAESQERGPSLFDAAGEDVEVLLPRIRPES